MSRKDYGRCLVCDDVAIGMNFGVPTCMPCKAFFRRNAVKLGIHQFVCDGDGHCIITNKYRSACNCCRLAKCFRVGMNKSLILSIEEREARNKLVEINRVRRGKIPKKQSVEQIQPVSLVRMTKSVVQCLPPSDQTVLANIFNAYENTCIAAKKNQFPQFPVIQHTRIYEFVNEISSVFSIIIDYFKHIPEFASIAMDDKLRLVKNHFGPIIGINQSLMYPVTSSNLIVTWRAVFGPNITGRLLKHNQTIEQYLVDPMLLKLVLIILVLSSGNDRNHDSTDIDQVCDDTLSIFFAQSVYVELLWRYILSRSSTEEDAVKFLNELIMFILYLQRLHLQIDGYINSLKDEVKQMEPVMQSMWAEESKEENVTNTNISQDSIFQH